MYLVNGNACQDTLCITYTRHNTNDSLITKEVPDGPEYKIDHHSRSGRTLRTQRKHDQEIHPETADCLCEAVRACRADSH
ncbi:hypothetical protein NSPZN2_10440 [Nitrospira defluvii]|uniref:Uncharacterized protein n=1 Tax=Nitrospira defluvii TaxID=330214 RepID=A0ABN7KJ25_9BACT|nr:hypothetical protein NSPZN2_10440 [Nitrospira defluvii]